jgi:YD repeat-containing protein
MANDREKAKLRGSVARFETRAKSLIQWPGEPPQENEWVEEICVYDTDGRLVEWFSRENQVLEQEAIRQRFVYDADGKLIEKLGYGEDDSEEEVRKYFYDENGKLKESIYVSLLGFSRHHIFYDERGDAILVQTYDGKDDSLRYVQRFTHTYIEHDGKLEEHFEKEEGHPPSLRKTSQGVKTVTTFDHEGNKIKRERYLKDRLEIVTTYNVRGQEIEQKWLSPSEIVSCRYTYAYDDEGNLITFVVEDGSRIKKHVNSYDEWNNLTAAVAYDNVEIAC